MLVFVYHSYLQAFYSYPYFIKELQNKSLCQHALIKTCQVEILRKETLRRRRNNGYPKTWHTTKFVCCRLRISGKKSKTLILLQQSCSYYQLVVQQICCHFCCLGKLTNQKAGFNLLKFGKFCCPPCCHAIVNRAIPLCNRHHNKVACQTELFC